MDEKKGPPYGQQTEEERRAAAESRAQASAAMDKLRQPSGGSGCMLGLAVFATYQVATKLAPILGLAAALASTVS